MTNTKRIFLALILASAAALPISAGTFNSANAATAEDLNKDAGQALQSLYRTNALASQMTKKARAVIVFPSVVKAGLVFGGSYGEGVLKRGATVIDYYNSVSGSWGLQAGAQSYSYVVFLMNDNAVKYIGESHGCAFRVTPSVLAGDLPLVVDWRADIARPFYRARPGDPHGLVGRRRFGFQGAALTEEKSTDTRYLGVRVKPVLVE